MAVQVSTYLKEGGGTQGETSKGTGVHVRLIPRLVGISLSAFSLAGLTLCRI